jgi:hypothetical protein
MRKTIRFIGPMLAAAAAAAIMAAPIAAAETHLDCSASTATSTQCETPGNVQLNSSPPVTAYQQYPFIYGPVIGFGGGFGGGFHGGGGGFHGGGGGHR